MYPPKGLIIALDTDSRAQALAWVERFVGHTPYFKVGLELFSAEGPRIIEDIHGRGGKVFLDLKLFDIPNTVERACRTIARLGVWMCTVHASGGAVMLQAARQGLSSGGGSSPLLLAVTVLTSAPETADTGTQVLALTRLAEDSGCDGVVASGKEVSLIRNACGNKVLVITPGVRLAGQAAGDQSRVVTPKAAFDAGANFIVMGRGILNDDSESSLEELIHQCQVSA